MYSLFQTTPAQVRTMNGVQAAKLFNFLLGTTADDLLDGSPGRDIIIGRAGNDTLSGLFGNDILIGGRGGDTYRISALDGGTDTVLDKGDLPVINGYYSSNLDHLALSGLGQTDAALRRISLDIQGDHLILSFDNADTGISGQINIRDQFSSAFSAIETISFNQGTAYHISNLSGDDYTYSVHAGPDQGGEDLVLGTDSGDEIYGGISDDILFGGAGADHFMFHDEDDASSGHDTILDFDLAEDKLDFTDIAGFDMSGISVSQNTHGEAVISSAYCEIDLIGISQAAISEDIFAFA